MHISNGKATLFFVLFVVGFVGLPATGQKVKLNERPPDPHGSPRPARSARDVPVRTSLYVELEVPQGRTGGDVDPESVSVRLQSSGGSASELIQPGGVFAEGCRGWLRPKQDLQGRKALAIYIEPAAPLQPATTYTVSVAAGPAGKPVPASDAGAWSFTTGVPAAIHAIAFPLDLRAGSIEWHGRFFSGICNVVFCTQADNYGPTYDLMAEARKQHTRAWSYQRDFWMTGSDHRPQGFFPVNLPNIVRERETRRITAITPRDKNVVLHVEDFFGHQQYGIPSGRPVSEDYHAGDEVLIADGPHDARTKVISADDSAGTVTVASVANPPGGWKIAYEGPLPKKEDPDAPGLFAPGGCYLRKFTGRSGSTRTKRARTGCRRPTLRRPTLTLAMGFSRPGASTSFIASSFSLLVTRVLRTVKRF
jgi:hypothetical protein